MNTKQNNQRLNVSNDTMNFLERSGIAQKRKSPIKTLCGVLAGATLFGITAYGALSAKQNEYVYQQENIVKQSYLAEQDGSTIQSYSIEQICEKNVSKNKSSGLEKQVSSKNLAKHFKKLNEQYPISEEQIQSYIKTAMQMVPDLSPEITPEFVRYIIKIESMNNPNAVSKSGARGFGQQKKEAWYEATRKRQDVGDSDRGLPYDCAFDPYTNIEATVAYLDWVAKHVEERNPKWDSYGKIQKQNQTSAAYNAGPTALGNMGYNINKMRQETKNYIKKLDKLRKESEKA